VSPTVAAPVAKVDLTIASSLELIGEPEINLDEDLPEWAQYENLNFIDTLTFALSDIDEEAEAIRFIEVNLLVWNDFPTTASAQLLFLGDDDQVVDSLFSPGRLEVNSGVLSENGEVESRGYSIVTVLFDDERIDRIIQANRVVFSGQASNAGITVNQFNYYPNLVLSLKLSARVGLNLNL
ncbi:MAG: hypothetical protein ACLFNU_03120, partial [Bacteroidales bacterium]